MSLRIRKYTPQDLEALVELIKAANRADSRQVSISPGRAKELWSQPNLFPEEDFLLAENDGALVGYLALTRELPVGRVILEGAVHPAQRGRGIGNILLREGLSQGRKLGVHLAHVAVVETWGGLRRFLEREGFRVVRRYWQMRLEATVSLPTIVMPPDLVLMTFRPGEESKLTAAQNRAFTGSWGFCPNTVEEIGYRLRMSFYQPEGVIFLCRDQEVLGYCWTRVDEDENRLTGDLKGYIYMVGVDPSLRRKGLGRILVLAGASYIRTATAGAVELEVDSENLPAVELYQSLGFHRKGVILWYERHLGSGEG